MRHKAEKLTLWNGEIIELRYDENELPICPVCGYIEIGQPAYHDGFFYVDNSGQPYGDSRVGASHETCSCCRTQYGDTDFPDAKITTVKEKWSELREAWLKKVGKTKEVIDQLKNIDIFLDDEPDA